MSESLQRAIRFAVEHESSWDRNVGGTWGVHVSDPAFAGAQILRRLVLQVDGRFCQGAPASHAARGIRAVGSLGSSGITRLPRYCGPLRHRLAFDRIPGGTGYTAYLAPALSHWDEDGFSSCSACPVSPCCPYHPAEVPCGIGQAAAWHAAFVPDERTRPSD